MSCFQTSKFLKNSEVFSKEILMKAVERLNWECIETSNSVVITNIPDQKVPNEYVMKVEDSKVTYNSYYLSNGSNLIETLKETFHELNVEYARETILKEFKSVGFSLKKDYDFVPNEIQVDQFYMIAYSTNKNENLKRSEIRFTILNDGTILSDTNYLPDDIHKLANQAMLKLEEDLGNTRREEDITNRKVPLKYQNKIKSLSKNKLTINN